MSCKKYYDTWSNAIYLYLNVHSLSLLQTTAQTVLEYVNTNMTRLDKNIPVLIAALDKPVYFATKGDQLFYSHFLYMM